MPPPPNRPWPKSSEGRDAYAPPVPTNRLSEVSYAVRTIEIDASKPLLISFTVVAAPVPWERSRLEFTAATPCSEGIRLCFSDPEDVRTFAALVRRFATDCRELDRVHPTLYSPFQRPTLRRPHPPRPKPLSFLP